MSEVVYEENNYRGIPYTIYYYTETPWSYVDPQNEDNFALGIFSSNYSGHSHIGYPHDYADKVQGAIHDACQSRIKQLAKSIKKDYSPEEWKEHRADYTAEEIAEEYLGENYQTTEPAEIKDLFDRAGVDYLEIDYIGSSQGDYCKGILFRPDGRKLTKAQHKFYKALHPEIKNWIYNEVYCVEVPGKASLETEESFFIGIEYPGRKNCPVEAFVKKEIDALLAPKTGKYTIVAPYAVKNEYSMTKVPEHNYDGEKKIKIFADDLETAEAIARFYGDDEQVEIIETKTKKAVLERE